MVGLLPFLVKLPVFFFHFWLPKAHVEAPVFGSVLLAGALLKLGGFGSYILLVFIKLRGPWVFFIIFIIFCMCLVLIQRDIKRIVAYLSVAHMGRLIFMYFSGATWAWPLAKVLILSHAITSPLFFLFVNEVYLKVKSRSISGGVGGVLQGSFSETLFLSSLLLMNLGLPPFLRFFFELVFMLIFVIFFKRRVVLIFLGFCLGGIFFIKFICLIFF